MRRIDATKLVQSAGKAGGLVLEVLQDREFRNAWSPVVHGLVTVAKSLPHAISETGAPCAALWPDAEQGTCLLLGPDGSLGRMRGTLRLPATILFRFGTEPTLMYAAPGVGFLSARPG